MDLGIHGRTALVCGASSGIGFAIARSLIREGVQVAICARNQDKLKRAQVALQQDSESAVISVSADLGKKVEIENLIERVESQLGAINILINNVGGPAPGSLLELEDSQWYDGFELSLMSIVRLTKAVLPRMQKEKWGRIIAIASNTAKEPRAEILLSSTLRAAVCAFNKGIAAQLAPYNIAVHSVCPGPISTDRVLNFAQAIATTQNLTLQQAQDSLTGNLPMGRLGEPDEVANLVTYLASERCHFMTGNAIAIDGGQLRSW